METLNHLAASVPADRAESFLVELLNSDVAHEFVEDSERTKRFFERFTDLLPQNLSFGLRPLEPRIIASVEKARKTECLKALRRARVFLAAAWRAPTSLGREVFLLQLLALYMQTDEPQFSLALGYNAQYADEEIHTRIDRFCLVLIRALHALDRMRYCLNPECPVPYFFAKKLRQKYCSEACAGAGQRDLKRKWWADHGKGWRKARMAKAKESQKKKGKRS